MEEITLYVPLRNLGWIYPEVLLNKNTKIRFLNYIDETENNGLKRHGLNQIHYSSVLIYKHFYKKEDDLGPMGYIKEIDKIVTFLQLFVNKKIFYERYFNLDEITDKVEGFSHKKLKPAELKLVEMWKKFCKIYDDFQLSFSWYNKSLGYTLPPREQILYLVIALEGVILKEVTDELSYRFALRGAFLLGKSKAARKRYFELLRQAYQYRSYVVHSNQKESLRLTAKIGSMYHFNERLLEYSSKLLQNLVKNPKILRNIENKII